MGYEIARNFLWSFHNCILIQKGLKNTGVINISFPRHTNRLFVPRYCGS